MTATVPGSVLLLLAELEQATTDIIERHFAADEKRTVQTLTHWAPFDVRVYNVDGYLARFLEEGLELYPDEDRA